MSTPIKERPILFKGAMVRALLAGTKTQTRRIVKPQPDEDTNSPLGIGEFHLAITDRHGDLQPGPLTFGAMTDDGELCVKCPYGQPGERLWVRETWKRHYFGQGGVNAPGVMYAADNAMRWVPEAGDFSDKAWVPSIHMNRWASRILLEIVPARVERLNDISEADAVAEGIEQHGSSGWWKDYACDSTVMENPTGSYRTLWESINGPHSWQANPWVWVVEFRRIDA